MIPRRRGRYKQKSTAKTRLELRQRGHSIRGKKIGRLPLTAVLYQYKLIDMVLPIKH
jgi:hypothetical protein